MRMKILKPGDPDVIKEYRARQWLISCTDCFGHSMVGWFELGLLLDANDHAICPQCGGRAHADDAINSKKLMKELGASPVEEWDSIL